MSRQQRTASLKQGNISEIFENIFAELRNKKVFILFVRPFPRVNVVEQRRWNGKFAKFDVLVLFIFLNFAPLSVASATRKERREKRETDIGRRTCFAFDLKFDASTWAAGTVSLKR